MIGLGSTGGSFVQRLRKSTAVLSAPVTSIPCAAAVPSLEECQADPTYGVHTLYAIVQELNAKLAEVPAAAAAAQSRPVTPAEAVRSRPPPDVVKALQRENGMLKLENSNMYFLKKENEELKAQLAVKQQSNAQPDSAETERLKSELDVLRKNYMVLLQGNPAVEQERPKTAAEVIESCEAEYDADLAELFRRNERGLAECRAGLAQAKVELGGRGSLAVGGNSAGVPAPVLLPSRPRPPAGQAGGGEGLAV